jgi:CRP-like cAMP-binding protein
MITIMSADPVARLIALSDRDVTFRHGERVFGAGDAVRSLFIVREGSVLMIRRTAAGAALVVQRALPGVLLAEASVFARKYHCDAVAEGTTRLARIAMARVTRLQVEEPDWLRAFAAHLAGEVQRARSRAELLSLRTVSERLDAWFSLHPGPAPERGHWADWASELGVSPEALYRELARRRD